MTKHVVENWDDDEVWGYTDQYPGVKGWAFAELIIRFCRVANTHDVPCPLKSRYECRDLKTIKQTMFEVFSKLPNEGKMEVTDYYHWFLEKDKVIDWELFGQERPDQVVLSGDKLHNSMKAIEEHEEQRSNKK